MRWGGALTKSGEQKNYARCFKCELIFQDDVRHSGIVLCPHCQNDVERGVSKDIARVWLDDDQKELLQ